MNKGFTLVELLAVIVILSLVTTVGVVSFSSITNKSNSDYYHNLEINLEMAASNYFSDYRSKRPAINIRDDNTFACSEVTLTELVEKNYTENVLDSNGKNCDLENSKVIIKRNEKKQYEYKALLSCESYSSLLSNEELNNYCSVSTTNINSSIIVSAMVDGNVFDIKRSSGAWTNKNIEVTFESSKQITRYLIINRQNNDEITCDTLTGYKCTHIFNDYGSFSIQSYDNTTLVDEITIYIRIDKDKPIFDFNFNDNQVYLINTGTKYAINFSLTNINDNSGISLIKYKIANYDLYDFNPFIDKSTTNRNIQENLSSGDYVIKVRAQDNALNESDEVIKRFKIARQINLIDLNNDTTKTFNVIDNYAYNALGISLPILNDENKTFLGWYTGISSGVKISDASNVDSTIDNLYARWGD